MRVAVIVPAILLASPGSAPAQPAAEPLTEAAPETDQPIDSLEVSAQLWAVIARYRFAATADRVRITLAEPSGRSDMHSLVVRCIPGAAGLARLELGEMVLTASGGRLVAVHADDPTTYALVEAAEPGADPADVLRLLLPPLPIPQLSLAFDEGDVEWCPYVADVRWHGAERLIRGGERGMRLTGASPSGQAVLEVVAGRVRRFEAELGGPSGPRLIVECEPIAPGDLSGWAIDTSDRVRVDSVARLRPLGAPLGPGASWPRTPVVRVGGSEARPWPEEAPPGATAHELRAVWLVRADEPPERVRAMAGTALRALLETRREILRGRMDGRFDKRLGLRQILALTLAEQIGGSVEDLSGLEQAWTAAVADAWPERSAAPEFGWTAAQPRLIDRLSPGAASVLVLIDGRGAILAVEPVSTESSATEVSTRLAAGLAVPALR